MTMLHPLSSFLSGNSLDDEAATYWYAGQCPKTGENGRLPRTQLIETIAHSLMRQLTETRSSSEGKMYGVLLVETPLREQGVLKAFSGLLDGQSHVVGWVPPIPGRETVAIAEANTLATLETIKQEILALQQLPERSQFMAQAEEFDRQLHQLAIDQAHRQHQRQHQRQHLLETLTDSALDLALKALDQQSQQDGIQRRRFKRDRDQQLQPLKQVVDRADLRLQELKQQRKQLSQHLQAQMHAAYSLTNFAGDSQHLQQLMPNGSAPTGTGDCCAPKLLHYAATHQLKPLALAEFWWGLPSANGDKVSGEFYGACADRCQPLGVLQK